MYLAAYKYNPVTDFFLSQGGVRPNMHFCFLSPSGRDQEFSVTGWPGLAQSKANNACIHLYAVHVHVRTWPGTW